VYEVVKRLAKSPENADLEPYVVDMARALGVRERVAKGRAAKRKAEGTATQPVPAVVTPPKP